MQITYFLVQGLCWALEAPGDVCCLEHSERAGAAGEDTGEQARDRL